MATIRDDVVKVGRRIVEAVEDRTGREIVPRERMEVLESERSDNRILRKTLEYIGFQLFNYQGNQPSPYRMPTDMLPQARIFAAGQSLRAWMEDPMAGQQVDLYVSFVFGSEVPRGRAHDDEVQNVLDSTWEDAANQRVLTSFDRLVEKGVDLSLQSNVYWTLFDDGMDGTARLSLKRFEDVLDVVRHPVDTYRILYYKVSERPLAYDYGRDAYVTPPGDEGKTRIVYYESADAFNDEDPVMVAQDQMAGPDLAALKPPAGRLRPGKIVHLAVNKSTEMAFGVPRMRRLFKWLTAYNDVYESHVNRMKAMASIYMKMTAKGDQRELDKLAMMATGRQSAFGAAQGAPPGSEPRQHRVPGPTETGIITQNESVQFDPFKIDSGAADVSASLPQLRAQVSGIFPPCHDDQTETLTEDGWLTLAELKARRDAGDLPRVAAYDTGSDAIRFETPLKMLVQQFSGPMVRFRNQQRFDALVTPNHRMYVQRRDGWEVARAGDLRGKNYVRLAGEAQGERVESFVLPLVDEPMAMEYADARAQTAVVLRREGLTHREIAERVGRNEAWVEEALCGEPSWQDRHNPTGHHTIKMDDWMRFLGWYIAEGSSAGVCQQVNSPYLAEVQAACRSLGVPNVEYESGGQRRVPIWRWEPGGGFRKRLRRWLNANAGRGSAEKRVPPFVFGLAIEQRRLLLNALLAGDGNVQGDFNQFFSISRQLADDVQTLAVLDGRRAVVKPGAVYESRRGTRQGWWVYTTAGRCGKTGVSMRDASWAVLPRGEIVPYAGEVYCFSTPSQTVVTRRNGRVLISGNTYYGQDTGNLAGQQTVELPVLKFFDREQNLWLKPFRTLGRAAIQAAIRTGDLTEWRDPTQDEVQQIESWQQNGTPLDGLEFDSQTGQVKRDLGFDISLPSPLKRAMGDLVTAAVQTATAVDPMGQNPELSRWLFGFILAEAFDVEDPQRIVDQVLPRHVAEAMAAQGDTDPETGQPAAPGQTTATGADGQQHGPDNPYGAKVQSPNPEDRPVQETAADGRGRRRAALGSGRLRLVDDEFGMVRDAAAQQLRALGSVPALAANGNGNGNGQS